MSTMNDSSRQVAKPRVLNPIPSPTAHRGTPPLLSKSPTLMRSDGGLGTATAQLRKDLLALQRAIDAARGREPFNFSARALESRVVQAAADPDDQQVPALLTMLAEKVAEALGSAPSANGSFAAVVGDALAAGRIGLPAGSEADQAAAPASDAASEIPVVRSSRPPSQQVHRSGTPKPTTPARKGATMFDAEAVALPPALLGALAEHGVHLDATVAPGALVDVVERLTGDLRVAKANAGASPQRARAAMDNSKHQALIVEIDALRTKLAGKELELAEMRHQLSSSRYAFNAPRTLTTVRDAPMSFEVERQYQRELHRLAARVKELEADYAQLLDAGAADRNRVKALTDDCETLRRTIADNQKQMQKLLEEKAEQTSLFQGVSRARGEEARMSLVAVKQLESRVATLEEQLKKKTDECANLLQNARHLWQAWHTADSELSIVSSELLQSREEFEAYSRNYNDEMATLLEEAQREVLRLGRRCDEQTAATTIQKQRLEDADMLRTLSISEHQLWMERLKSSTEWKLLNVKSPEETKQLAVRLLMLTGEKEKKENTMISSHAERLGLFKSRAEREVEDRCARREHQLGLREASAARTRWSLEAEQIRARHEESREQVADGSRSNTRLRYTDVVDGYFQEALARVVEFRAYFNDQAEARAASDVQ